MNIARENEKLKVAAYCRVSTKLEGQKSSIEAQINYYTKLIEENSKWENAGIYIDYGSRCRIKGRPAFSKMIENALSGEIDLIITKSISRFSGNTVDMFVVIRELKEKEIEVYFEKEQISSLDAKAEQMITIYTAIAQEEVRNMSENIKWGYEQKFARGEVMNNYKNFYGYYVHDSHQEIISKEDYFKAICERNRRKRVVKHDDGTVETRKKYNGQNLLGNILVCGNVYDEAVLRERVDSVRVFKCMDIQIDFK